MVIMPYVQYALLLMFISSIFCIYHYVSLFWTRPVPTHVSVLVLPLHCCASNLKLPLTRYASAHVPYTFIVCLNYPSCGAEVVGTASAGWLFSSLRPHSPNTGASALLEGEAERKLPRVHVLRDARTTGLPVVHTMVATEST